jgi:hypothetical protein
MYVFSVSRPSHVQADTKSLDSLAGVIKIIFVSNNDFETVYFTIRK